MGGDEHGTAAGAAPTTAPGDAGALDDHELGGDPPCWEGRVVDHRDGEPPGHGPAGRGG